ncbi:MAG: DUF421 domain-containing protein [Peptococcaceae bacterium]|jgi:uncharacterized membrane protein YcaP (DUF421 family)|nr:DUF421 domain-containing protein [Peptococcaceae bacterium]
MLLWEYLFRTLLVYFAVLAVIRLMGKREIGQLSPFDFVVTIIIAELAVIPLEATDTPLWQSMIPLAFLGALQIAVSYATLLSHPLRCLICGVPQIIIKNGQILRDEMRKARYNLDDLLAQMREKGIVDPAEVEFAVLEVSGKLSIIPKSQYRPVIPADLGISTPYEGLPTILIKDGTIMRKNLRDIDLDLAWLEEAMRERRLTPGQVLLATLGTDGRLYVSRK